ncbi:MAG: hypothetical protein ACI9YL_001436 [Luteibaculaceae bacterium]|jgi:hypothetical protein
MDWIFGIGTFAIFFVSLVAIIRFQRHQGLKVFSWFLWISFFFEMILHYTAGKMIHNWWIIDVFCIFEVLFLFLFLSQFIPYFNNHIRLKSWGLILIACYFVGLIFGGETKIHWVFVSLVVFCLSAFSLATYCLENEKGSLFKDPFFWVLSGMVLYYGVTSLTFNPFVILKKGSNLERFLPLVNQVMNILAYIFYSIGYLCKKPAILTS